MLNEYRKCPECGSECCTYVEVRDGLAEQTYDPLLYDYMECDDCGTRYRLVFRYIATEVLEGRE